MRSCMVLSALALTVFSACDVPVEDGTRVGGVGPAMHERAWGSNDRPGLMADDLVFTYADLPASGEAKQTPWTGNYWPTYQDSINHRWDGEDSLSPAEKFEKAFGKEGFVDRISAQYGIDSQASRTACDATSTCADAPGTCSMRRGEEAGYCIETWFGICHAWAPAAIMEPEPRAPVTMNGVEFKVNDIKALMTLAYDKGLETNFMSLRCNKKGHGDDDDAVTFDEFDIPQDPECVDTNPGSFHIVMANFLGLRGDSLVVDRTFDYEVWNQPVRGYEITRDAEISRDQAIARIKDGVEGSFDNFSPMARSFREIHLSMKWIGESDAQTDGHLGDRIDRYTHTDRLMYILELDGAGRIVGGEWIGPSKVSHPDFMWVGTAKRDIEIAGSWWQRGQGMTYAEVKSLLDASVRQPIPPRDDATTDTGL